MNSLSRYYLFGLVPFFCFLILCILLGLSFEWALYLAIGFMWPYAFSTPGFIEKIQKKEYRLSLLKVLYYYQRLYERWIKKEYSFFQRVLPPVVLSCLLLFFYLSWNPICTLLGALIYEAWRFLIYSKTNLLNQDRVNSRDEVA